MLFRPFQIGQIGMIGWLFLSSVTASGMPAAEWEGRVVKEIRHQPQEARQPPLEAAELERIVVQKAGEPFHAQTIRESMQRLFATGRYEDIQVDARGEPDGVVVTFLTVGRYFVGSVAVGGVDAPPSESQLVGATRLQLGRRFNEEVLAEAVEGLRHVLEEDGYFQPEIDTSTERYPETQQINISFEVRTGERARLGEVQVSGAPAFPSERVIRQTKWKSGQPLTAERVREGLERLRRLYREENYLEVSLGVAGREFHPETNRVDLGLEIAAGNKVEVAVTGTGMSRSEMERQIPIFEEGTVDEDLLREGERNLRNYFQSQGYFDAQVRYSRQEPAPGRVAIHYEVDRGPRQSLQGILISGNRYFQTEVLRERMQIQPADLRNRYGRFSSRLLAQDLVAIESLYRSNGFSGVKVTSTRQDLEPESGILVSIQVEEAPQTLIGRFSISGNRFFPFERLGLYINADSGQPFSNSLVASDRDNLLTFYFNQGFPDARFQWNATPSENGRMDLEYALEEGEREYVRHIYIGGLEHTRRGVVNRQLQLRDGLPLSQGDLLETQRRLYDLSIFNQVEIAVQNPPGEEQERNILIQVEEARRYTLAIGLGAEVGRFGGRTEDVTNVEGKNDFSPDVSLDITRLNVGGRPHTASFRSRFSGLQKRAALTYTAPRFLNREALNASATTFFDETRDVRTFTARRIEGSIQFENRRSRATTLLHRYAFRRVTVDTSTLRISEDQIPIFRRPVLVGMLSQTLLRDTRDVPTDAHRGMFTSADLGIAAKQLGSQTSFVKLLLQNSSFHMMRGRLVLARTSQFGLQTPFGAGRSIEVPADDGSAASQEIRTNEIPLAERFFSGGSNSHRGFAVNQAGPRDPFTGFALGGNALLLNSVELRFPIWGPIGGVLFHDTGNVFTKISDFSLRQHQKSRDDFNYISHAAGMGLRYRTPVGPVRFDLGYNFNPTRFLIQTGDTPEPQSLSRWQVLFSIGQNF